MIYNKLLQRQIKKIFKDKTEFSDEVNSFINLVNDSYNHYEKDNRLTERAMELSSTELIELNACLQRETEEAIKARAVLESLLKNIEEVFFSIDVKENKVLHFSSACTKVYGHPVISFIENPELWQQVIIPEDYQASALSTNLLLPGLNNFIDQYRIKHADGSIRWVETKISKTLNNEGEIIRIDGITSDVTKRKQAEIAVAENEIKFRTLIQSSLDLIQSVNTEGGFEFVNESWVNALGYSMDEIKRLTVFDILSTEHFHDCMITFKRVLAGEVVANIKTVFVTKTGNKITLEGNAAPKIVNNKVVGTLSFFRDITEREKSDDKLKEQNLALIKTNEELDKFVYSVSHDLRAPLCSMLGIIEIACEETTDETILDYLNKLRISIIKLDGFIADILDYSRNSRMELKNEKINMKELLDEVVQKIKFTGNNFEKIKMNILVNEKCSLYSDKSRIGVILNNIISNAICYHNSEINNPFVNINIDMSDTETDIIVQDNGIGIPFEQKEKIFDMFYRISKKSTGSGLGLYIVKETVNKLNGNIEVDSEPGKGSAFKIRIPTNSESGN